MNNSYLYILFNSFTLRRIVSKRILLFCMLSCFQVVSAEAAIPIAEVIRQAVKRVIVAVDLQVQRLQNETIALQQAQQKLENLLSKTRLEEIANWSEKQKELYGDYYQSLWKVKQLVAQYQRVREIGETQKELIQLYSSTYKYLRESNQFSAKELELIHTGLGDILNQSILNLDELTRVLKSMGTQQSDASRLDQIHRLDIRMEKDFRNLKRMALQLEGLAKQRTREQTGLKTNRLILQ